MVSKEAPCGDEPNPVPDRAFHAQLSKPVRHRCAVSRRIARVALASGLTLRAYGLQRHRPSVRDCLLCGYQSSCIAGTVFEHTELPLSVRFPALYLMTQHKTRSALWRSSASWGRHARLPGPSSTRGCKPCCCARSRAACMGIWFGSDAAAAAACDGPDATAFPSDAALVCGK